MKKLLLIVLGCLLGLANGFIYFFATSFAYEAFTYSVEMFYPAFIGFAIICLLNIIFFLLIRKKCKTFALSLIITAALSDLVFLVVMSSIRYYY